LILLLIFVVRTSASDCLDSETSYNVSSGTLDLTHSLSHLHLSLSWGIE